MRVLERPVKQFLRLDLQIPTTDAWVWGRSKWGIDQWSDEDTSIEWTSYTCEITHINIKTGSTKDQISNAPETGTLTVTFKNAANPIIDPNIHPKVPIRLMYILGTEFTVFKGKILDIQNRDKFDKSTGLKTTFTTIVATDAVAELANTMRYGAGELDGFEKWEERIERLAASSTVPVVLPVEGTPILRYQYDYYDFDATASGDGLDYWTRFGTYPSGVTGAADQTAISGTFPGQRVGVGVQSSNGFAFPKTLAADTYGARRTITGLTPGKTYKLNMGLAYIDPTAIYALGTVASGEHFSRYKIGVKDIGHSSEVDLRTGTILGSRYLNEMPEYEFIATDTTHQIEYILSTGNTRTAASTNPILETVAAYDVTVYEDVSSYDERLQSVAYESSLANHFTLACDSVGAYWYVNQDGEVEFKRELDTPGITAIFTDTNSTLGLAYVDIDVNYDSRNIVNNLNIINHGMKDDGSGNNVTNDITTLHTDETSIATWGPVKQDLHISLYNEGALDDSVDNRAAEILDEYRYPKKRYRKIRWNAQENTEAIRNLTLYAQIKVERELKFQDSRISGITIDITPRRWMVELDIFSETGTELYETEES